MEKVDINASVSFETLANLFPRQLDMLSQETLIGYQIIDAYHYAIMYQYQLLDSYLRSPLSMEERQRVDALRGEFGYNKRCAERWPDIKAFMGRVYERAIQPLILSYEMASEKLSQLVRSFEEPGSKMELLQSLQNLKDDTENSIKSLTAVKSITINFREHLEETVRYNQEFINKQLVDTSNKSQAEFLTQSIAQGQTVIADLNFFFLHKAYNQRITRSFAVNGIINAKLKNALALATTSKEYLTLPSTLENVGSELVHYYERLQKESSQLAEIKRELNYFNLFSHEFTKFQKSILNAIAANINLSDTWSNVSSNLGTLIERLDKVKSLTEEDKNTIIKLHLVVLKKSIANLKHDMEQFNKNKLLPIEVMESLKEA